jgi:hypothetical protein
MLCKQCTFDCRVTPDELERENRETQGGKRDSAQGVGFLPRFLIDLPG